MNSNNVHSRYTIVKKGKLVTFYRNGDPYHKGLQTSVSGKHFVTLSTLLSWLNDKIPIAAGVQYIFRLPDGHEITDVTQFVAGRSYAVSSTRKLNTSIQYGDVSRKCHTHGDDEPCDEESMAVVPSSNFQNNVSHVGKGNSPIRNSMLQHSWNESNLDSKPKHQKSDAISRQQILDNLNNKSHHEKQNDYPNNIAGDVSLLDNDFLAKPEKENHFKPFTEDFKSSVEATNSDEDKQPTYRNHPRYYLPRSEPRSFQSSAESSGSGSDKLSRFELPRNKTFLPVYESDQDTLPDKRNSSRKESVAKYEKTSRTQRPRKNSDVRSTRKSDSLPRLDTYRQGKTDNNAEWNPNKSVGLPNDKNYHIIGSYSANEDLSHHMPNHVQSPKIWSPLSLQNDDSRRMQNFRKAKPRIILIRSNTVRKSKQRVIFNPNVAQLFEEVLRDMENMVKLLYPPATALFTAEEPFVKVLSFSHLSTELRSCEEFLVCGREALPIEIHPDHIGSYQPSVHKGAHDRGFLPPVKTFRSEDNIYLDNLLFFKGTSNHHTKPQVRDRQKNSDTTPPVTSSSMRLVNIYLGEKPKDENIACDGKNCNCRLHETLFKLIKTDHQDSGDFK
ncbi:hypothetical protein HELRODRAFT_183559 [Helobdella robusta]|uniref:Doublecortin domain-containing protein n=1 Tax=Helobdella robusta TaxID=6412 RepID=T1FJU6_HELRO|nr:hypothetical protein HELRODRAFT_183559 [Helobdella robusta]ESO10527.1 hypothetical protein HELRODRAFT_183559 [Helobdella robusta]